MFRAYALRVMMFGPHASPVVNAHRTWHIDPTTCVSTSRSLAYEEIQSSSRSATQRRISATCASRNRASWTASSVVLQTKQDALVIRSRSTYVLNPPDSAAARAPRFSPSASCRARIDAGSFLRGQRFSSIGLVSPHVATTITLTAELGGSLEE